MKTQDFDHHRHDLELHAELNSELHTEVRVFLAEYFMVREEIGNEMLLVDDLGADSLDLLQVVHMLNDRFDIEIDVDALPSMLTVGGVCHVVENFYVKT